MHPREKNEQGANASTVICLDRNSIVMEFSDSCLGSKVGDPIGSLPTLRYG